MFLICAGYTLISVGVMALAGSDRTAYWLFGAGGLTAVTGSLLALKKHPGRRELNSDARDAATRYGPPRP